MNKKLLIRSIAFLLIFIALFSSVSRTLSPKWVSGNMETISANEFYSLPKNTIETIFVGSSQIVDGINLAQAYLDYGLSGYALAGSNFPPLINYYWVKNAYRTQGKSLKLVVMDTSMFYESVEDVVRYRKSIDSMRFSLEKIQASVAHCLHDEGLSELPSYLFNIINYHSRWNDLKDVDYDIEYEEYRMYNGTRLRGEIWDPEFTYEEFITDNDVIGQVDEEHLPNEFQIGYARKLIEFCQSKGIKVVLIKTPKETWTATASQGVKEIAEEYSLEFIDFTTDETLKTIDFDFRNDMKDHDHLNVRGSTKFTNYLVDHLMKNYDLTDYREVEDYEFKKLDLYRVDYEDKWMKSCVDVDQFMEMIVNPIFDVLITSTDDITDAWTQEYQELFDSFGIKEKVADLKGKNYVFLIHGGECVYEEVSDKPISYKGAFQNGREVIATADISKKAGGIMANIGGMDKLTEAGGMNFYIMNYERRAYSATMTLAVENGELTLVKSS